MATTAHTRTESLPRRRQLGSAGVLFIAPFMVLFLLLFLAPRSATPPT